MNPLPSPDAPPLVFSPLAWLKLQFFCHAGDTEVGGFAISRGDDLLHIEDFVTVRQDVSPVTVRFHDDAVADFFDRCVDDGLETQQCGRIWCHTHPGNCVQPSQTDEETFARVFGSCDWALMFILARGGASYARLRFRAGPGASFCFPFTSTGNPGRCVWMILPCPWMLSLPTGNESTPTMLIFNPFPGLIVVVSRGSLGQRTQGHGVGTVFSRLGILFGGTL